MKLTQIGCVSSISDADSFFRIIKPSGIEDYLDNYKLGGDLLQALNMTREWNVVIHYLVVETVKGACLGKSGICVIW